jgi:hypothetical protein
LEVSSAVNLLFWELFGFWLTFGEKRKRGGDLAEQKANIRVGSPDAWFHRLFTPPSSTPASSVLPQHGSFTKSISTKTTDLAFAVGQLAAA